MRLRIVISGVASTTPPSQQTRLSERGFCGRQEQGRTPKAKSQAQPEGRA